MSKPQKDNTNAVEGFPRVPALPAILRYYDDFADEYREVEGPARRDTWTIVFDGGTQALNFNIFPADLRHFVKAWLGNILARLTPGSAKTQYYRIKLVDPDLIRDLVTAQPSELRTVWRAIRTLPLYLAEFEVLKSVLRYAAGASIGHWRPEWIDMIARLPVPQRDKYASVRTREVFLSVEEEEKLVRHIDEIATSVRQESVPDEKLKEGAILISGFQYGFRPKQIAAVRLCDVRIWADGLDVGPAVHVTFRMVKQRWLKRAYKLVRRIKREWAIIFAVLLDRMRACGLDLDDHLFSLSPEQYTSLHRGPPRSFARQAPHCRPFAPFRRLSVLLTRVRARRTWQRSSATQTSTRR